MPVNENSHRPSGRNSSHRRSLSVGAALRQASLSAGDAVADPAVWTTSVRLDPVRRKAGLVQGRWPGCWPSPRIGADRRSHQAAPPRRRRGRGRGRGHLDRGRDPAARGAVNTAGSLLVVKRAAPAARKSRQEFPSRLGLGQHPAREGLRTTVSTARELKQATPELRRGSPTPAAISASA